MTTTTAATTTDTGVSWYVNDAVGPLPDGDFAPLDRAPMRRHATLPGYRPTELHDLPELAARLGVAQLLVKDESVRMDLPSFKILGASWASMHAVAGWLGVDPATLDLPTARTALAGRGVALVAATDGNHGRGVARMARLLGASATILVPEGTATARIEAIASEGARVEVVEGTYDDAIAASAALAGQASLVVSDTSWPGYASVPRAVVEGYSTMFHEIDDAVTAHGYRPPSLVVLQAGVGAFAAAGLRHYRGSAVTVRAAEIRTAVVEPTSAGCLMASARAGRLTEVPGPHRSTMAGLNCGLPSELVWPLVRAGTDVFVAIDDAWTDTAMRALAAVGVVAGESGAAGLGALLAAADQPALAAAVGLDANASVLVVNTEGATDPENYAAVLARG
ncbi:diaminopropionate ammonia-lyase [uncultured Friedmanniella sp.]|uniref:diaminopropionate ammonia-lyase n=1 Tax=uncultured Friedmanniella sp. TaxID=335381 RepID=UPI0035C952EB